MKWDREEGILSETFFFWDLILLVLCLSLSRRNRAGGKLLSDDDRVLPLPGLLFST